MGKCDVTHLCAPIMVEEYFNQYVMTVAVPFSHLTTGHPHGAVFEC